MPCCGLASPNAEADRGQGRVVLTPEELRDAKAWDELTRSLQQESLLGARLENTRDRLTAQYRSWERPRSLSRLDGETEERMRNACQAMRDDSAAAAVTGALFYWNYDSANEDYRNR